MVKTCMSRFMLLTLVAALADPIALAQAATSRNPFIRPDIKQQSSPGGSAQKGEIRVAAPNFKVRATVVAGDASVANLDGNMLGLGETLDGYILVEVKRESVVMEKSGRQFTLRVAR